MTEEEELTVQRFAAIERGAAKGIARFERLSDHLWCEVPATHLETMRALARGEQATYKAACRAVARELAAVEAGKPLTAMSDIPRFLRRERVTC